MEDSFPQRCAAICLAADSTSRSEPVSELMDTHDQCLQPHVEYFLESVRHTLNLSAMSLATPEDAKRTLSRIRELQDKVLNHRLTAQALTKLLLTGLPPAPAEEPDSKILH